MTNTIYYSGYIVENYMGPNNNIDYCNTYFITKLKRFKPNYSCRETKKVLLLDPKDFYDKLDRRRKELSNLCWKMKNNDKFFYSVI